MLVHGSISTLGTTSNALRFLDSSYKYNTNSSMSYRNPPGASGSGGRVIGEYQHRKEGSRALHSKERAKEIRGLQKQERPSEYHHQVGSYNEYNGSFTTALWRAMEGGSLEDVERAVNHPAATDKQLIRLLDAIPSALSSTGNIGKQRQVRVAGLIVKRPDITKRSAELLGRLLADGTYGPVLSRKLPGSNKVPADMLEGILRDPHQPSGVLMSLCNFRSVEPGYFQVLCDHLSSHGVSPGETALLENPACPWELLLETTISPRAVGLVRRAAEDLFSGEETCIAMASALADGFTGTVGELLGCVEALCLTEGRDFP